MFLVIIVIQNTLEKPYLTNVLMKQNSLSVSPLSILVPRSLVPTYYRTNDTPQNSLIRSCKGTKEQRSKGSILMLSNDFRYPNFKGFSNPNNPVVILRFPAIVPIEGAVLFELGFLPIFAVFSIFKGITQPGRSGIKFPRFSCFPGCVGSLYLMIST
jgi:hypothetical protein